MNAVRVLLSLGSNLEPRAERIAAAVEALSQNVLTDVLRSQLYATEPVGFVDQPEFLNVAIVGNTTLTPEELFAACKSVEGVIGRQHRERWREREIDIDILLFGDMMFWNEQLTIPHPRMKDRRFVLEPAAEIAPSMVDPSTKRTIAELLAACADHSRVTPL